MEREINNIDAQDKIAGRLASRIAFILQGKHQVGYKPHIDSGDLVIVTNVAAMKFSGRKLDKKIYYHYSGYPGGIKNRKLGDLMIKDPAKVLREMVLHMLPDNRLRKNRIKRLTIS